MVAQLAGDGFDRHARGTAGPHHHRGRLGAGNAGPGGNARALGIRIDIFAWAHIDRAIPGIANKKYS